MFWWIWFVLLILLVIVPFGWGTRRWGAPRPSWGNYAVRYGRRRGTVLPDQQITPEEMAANDADSWGRGADLLYLVLVVLIVWAIIAWFW